MTTYYLVQGDDAPQIKVTLTRNTSSDVIDVSQATVLLKFRRKGNDAVLTTLESIATSEQKALGIAIFDWGSSDLDIPAGDYEAEIEVTFTDLAKVETVYEILNFVIREDF